MHRLLAVAAFLLLPAAAKAQIISFDAQWYGWDDVCKPIAGIDPETQTPASGSVCSSVHARSIVQGTSTLILWESTWRASPGNLAIGWGGIGIISFGGVQLNTFRQWFGNQNEWYSTEFAVAGAAGNFGGGYFEFYAKTYDGFPSQHPMTFGASEVTATPEPGSFMLMGTALVCFACGRLVWRRGRRGDARAS